MLKRIAVVTVVAVLATACHRGVQVGASNGTGPAEKKVVLPEGVTPSLIAHGDSVFNNGSCKKCHGANGLGSNLAPDLTDATWVHIDGSYDAIIKLVTTGFTKAEQKDSRFQFTMNPRGGMKLSDDDIHAVAAYVWSLSHDVKK